MKTEESHVWVAAETGVEQGVLRNGGTYIRPGLVTFSDVQKCKKTDVY